MCLEKHQISVLGGDDLLHLFVGSILDYLDELDELVVRAQIALVVLLVKYFVGPVENSAI
jgi:hypothetical protein